jgi:pSer/pThr/pTyr-binding forkhead associated (FHA) protein
VVVGGADGRAEGMVPPTVPVQRTVHLRLVDEGKPRTGGPNDLNALLVENVPLVVGRSREAELQVRDRQVSARHCTLAIEAGDGPVKITDLGSTNGTYVDGERVTEATLQDGQVLRLGESAWRVAVDPVTSDPALG